MKLSNASTAPRRLFFDDFELRLESGELLRTGVPVKLQPLPARVLEVLAGRSGEVVTREEIRQLVWGDAFLDFDASLNFCILQIRKALEDSATEPRFVETVPKRGYRFLKPVRIEPPPEEAQPVLEQPMAKWPWLAGVGAAGLAIVLLVVLVASRLSSSPSAPRLAVLPLECRSGDPADQQVCGGITETLTAELTRQFPRDLEVIAPGSALAYGKSLKDPQKVREKLRATHLLLGTADPSGQRLRITARLVRGDNSLWSESFETDLGGAALLYEQMVRRVAQGLHLPPPPVKPVRAAKPTAAGLELYLQGTYLLRQWEWEKAEAKLRDAITLAPVHAPAHAAYARVRTEDSVTEQDFAVAEASALHALELDPRLAEAHVALGRVFLLRHDWERAGQEFRSGLTLNPGLADAHYNYSLYLSFSGRHDEAIASVSRAHELDPASMLIGTDHVWLFYLARRYEEAIRQARTTLDLVPVNEGPLPRPAQAGQYWSTYFLFHSAREIGNQETALDAVKTLMRLKGHAAAIHQIHTLQDFWEFWRQTSTSSR